MFVTIKAISVEKFKDNCYVIELPSREFNEKERQILQNLFPNLLHRVEEIMGQEALLESLTQTVPVTETGVPVDTPKKKY